MDDVTPEAQFPASTEAVTRPSVGLFLLHRKSHISLESEKPAERSSLWVMRADPSQMRFPRPGAGDPSR